MDGWPNCIFFAGADAPGDRLRARFARSLDPRAAAMWSDAAFVSILPTNAVLDARLVRDNLKDLPSSLGDPDLLRCDHDVVACLGGHRRTSVGFGGLIRVPRPLSRPWPTDTSRGIFLELSGGRSAR
jgi:hypothetical protein